MRCLFNDATLPFFDSPAFVQPRSRKYVLAHGQPRQFGAVLDDHEKAALIASRTDQPNWLRVDHGRGAIYRTTLFAKLVSLAVIKFATLDPLGMGIEMEAGRPGWFDALNGLPGLFGSSLAETYELQRLIEFLLRGVARNTHWFIRITQRVKHALQYSRRSTPNLFTFHSILNASSSTGIG